MSGSLKSLWYKYNRFIEKRIRGNNTYHAGDFAFWREQLLIEGIIYSLPISLIALVPSVVITYIHGHILVPAYDIFALLSIAIITLNRNLSIHFKKNYLIGVLYVLGVLLIAKLGSFGIGSIYLLAVSVFITLTYTSKITYWSVFLNFIVYTSFSLIIAFKLFHSPLIVNYSLSYWIGYSLNFLFLNLIVVIMLCRIIGGFEDAIQKEVRLLKELKNEVEEKVLSNKLLQESERHYKVLFAQNPSPMWIFDTETLKFLQVNEAAVRRYGYTQEEFTKLTIKDIRPKADLEDFQVILAERLLERTPSQLLTRHQRKNGERFHVEVRCSTISFKGKEARLVIARNVNSQIEYMRAIELQNSRLREISFMQSHLVRAPLARIMGLTDLIAIDPYTKPDPNLISYLDLSAKELDQIIQEIVSRTENTDLVVIGNDLID